MKTIKIRDWTEVPQYYTGIVKYPNGNKFWYLNGKCHRENGPAVEQTNGTKWWYLHNKLHRIDGPAVEFASGSKEYWINGKIVSKKAQEILYAMYKLKGIL